MYYGTLHNNRKAATLSANTSKKRNTLSREIKKFNKQTKNLWTGFTTNLQNKHILFTAQYEKTNGKFDFVQEITTYQTSTWAILYVRHTKYKFRFIPPASNILKYYAVTAHVFHEDSQVKRWPLLQKFIKHIPYAISSPPILQYIVVITCLHLQSSLKL